MALVFRTAENTAAISRIVKVSGREPLTFEEAKARAEAAVRAEAGYSESVKKTVAAGTLWLWHGSSVTIG